MADDTGDRAAAPGVTAAAPRFQIPPLSKATETPFAIRRRLELSSRNTNAETDAALSEQLNQKLALAATPAKKRNNNAGPKTPATSRIASRSMMAGPSPGLRRIREQLGVNKENSSKHGGLSCKSRSSQMQKQAQEEAAAAARAVADAEEAAARAIDKIFAQQEGTLAAMSAALQSGSSNNSHLQQRIATAVEETTREQLAGLVSVGVRKGEDVRNTAVYWITMARFERGHGREEEAKIFLMGGIEFMTTEGKDNGSGTQIDALRLALARFDKIQIGNEKHGGIEQEDANLSAPSGENHTEPLPAPVAELAVQVQEEEEEEAKPVSGPVRRRSTGKSKPPGPMTPTRRSARIKARSSEKKKSTKAST